MDDPVSRQRQQQMCHLPGTMRMMLLSEEGRAVKVRSGQGQGAGGRGQRAGAEGGGRPCPVLLRIVRSLNFILSVT